MNNSEILGLLLEQHSELREQIDACEQAIDDAQTTPEQARAKLAVRIAELTRMLEEHNATEERLLKPVLANSDSFGEVRSDLMCEEHRVEYRSLSSALQTALSFEQLEEVTASVQRILTELREHIRQEERYYLNRRVVRDDIVSVDSMGG